MVMGMKLVVMMMMMRRNDNNTTLCAHLCKHVCFYFIIIKDYKLYHIIYVHMVLQYGL